MAPLFIEFEWNSKKDRANLKKHGVSFEEAKTIFNDPHVITFHDPDHSEMENRFLSAGVSEKGRFLTISHTDRDEKVRIINARRTTKKEKSAYEKEVSKKIH